MKSRKAEMTKTSGLVPSALRRGAPAPAAPVRVTQPPEPRRPFNPMQFLREVRAEARKVTWTSWKETWITSVMVGIMVVLTAMFFFGVDAVLSALVGLLLKLASAG
ncbi:MAG: preprotein translocase subunit SecE [Caulobacteraceae bacterium]|jgi:preprotein translocase subunit SecE